MRFFASAVLRLKRIDSLPVSAMRHGPVATSAVSRRVNIM
jgi:hypothetical protein